MSAHIKQTLAALLAAAAVVAPAVGEAKDGKDRGAKHEAREQSRGGADGRGGSHKQREARQHRSFEQRASHSPRIAFETRANGGGKRAKHDRKSEVFAGADRPNQRRYEKAEPKRFDVRSRHDEAEVVRRTYAQPDQRSYKSARKVELHIAKQQRAAYQAEAKQERRWAKQQHQAFKHAARVAPDMVYARSFADGYYPARNAAAPAYFAPRVRAYPVYSPRYDYAPLYWANDDDRYSSSLYPQSIYQSPAYAPYGVGYGDAGLGGLLGGGSGSIEALLVALLPALLGGDPGLGDLATDSLGSGLIGGHGTPDFAGAYEPYYQYDVGYSSASDLDGYSAAYADQGIVGPGQSMFGAGNGIASLASLALGSGLLGGDGGGLGGLGGLLGLGGSLGLDGSWGQSDPTYAHSDPYTSNGSLLTSLGI